MTETRDKRTSDTNGGRDWFAVLIDKLVIQDLSYHFRKGEYAAKLLEVEAPVFATILQWASSGPGRIGVDMLVHKLTKEWPVLSKLSGVIRNMLEDVKIELERHEKEGRSGRTASSDTSKIVNSGINKILAIEDAGVRETLLQRVFSLPSEELPVALQIFSTFDQKSLERVAHLNEPMWLNFEAQLIKPPLQKKLLEEAGREQKEREARFERRVQMGIFESRMDELRNQGKEILRLATTWPKNDVPKFEWKRGFWYNFVVFWKKLYEMI